MKILVAIKRVVDANVAVRVSGDGTGVATQNVKMAMNPFCEIAVEEAVRLKEQDIGSEIVAVSAGPPDVEQTLRAALALGADRAILVETIDELEPLAVAKLLREVAQREQPSLIMLGKQSIDGDNNQTGQMLAGLLGWPQATFVSEVSVEDNVVSVTREIDGGLEQLELDLPAVITTDLRLNQPRFASLPNIMKAKRKPLAIVTPAELGVDVARRTHTLKVEAPSGRSGGVRLDSVRELVERLRNEAKVI